MMYEREAGSISNGTCSPQHDKKAYMSKSRGKCKINNEPLVMKLGLLVVEEA